MGPTSRNFSAPDISIDELVATYGPWSAHNLEYEPGKYTLGSAAGAQWLHSRSMFFGSLAERALFKPLTSMRVLDIGCLEGGISFHLARLGAEVVGLEARLTHLVKAEFAARRAKLSNMTLVQGDMLSMDPALGRFDLIIAAGVLYHVDAPDLLPFLSSINSMCDGVMVLDTHVSQHALERYITTEGRTVFGRSIVEHLPQDASETKETKGWASYENNFAFWPTERSLFNLLADAGFKSAHRAAMPYFEWPWQDRAVYVADSRLSTGVCNYQSARMADPDPRPECHTEFFSKPHQVRPRNPSTESLYG